MRIVFAGNKERGILCLRALLAAGHAIVGVVAHPGVDGPGSVAEAARGLGLPLFQPDDVNDPQVVSALRGLKPELLVLAGYSPILRRGLIGLAPHGAVNLHAGELPRYRGSSPLNWALMNGEREFTLSIIRVDEGVDSGDVLCERTFPIGGDDTIADLHRIANATFPDLLVEVVGAIAAGTAPGRSQDAALAEYWPLRFPDDGLILWDLLTAAQVHNRIRALTDPYPGAFTYFEGRRVKLVRSELPRHIHHGEPGRVYRADARGLLVCAADRCVLVRAAVFEPGAEDALGAIPRYAKLTTVRDLALARLAPEPRA